MDWSQEYRLDKEGIKKAPEAPGVYQILQDKGYNRYKGTTRILKIGMSESNLRHELNNHLQRHTVANRIKRIRKDGRIITYQYVVTTADNAKPEEKALLRQFEEDFWDLPTLNSTRGYGRGEDNHFAKC